MTILLFVLGFILGAGAILFALQNTETVALTFFGWQFGSPLALLVILILAVGMLISLLAFLPSAIATSLRIMSLKNDNKKLATELEAHQQALQAAYTAPVAAASFPPER